MENLQIKLTFNKINLGDSPYTLKGNWKTFYNLINLEISFQMLGWIYPEECDCPEPDLEKWLSNMECKSTYSQIEEDLKPFTNIDMKQVFKEMKRKFNQPGAQSYVHYVIKNGQIYRRTFGEHVGFKMFMDSTLLSILGKVCASKT